MNFQQLVAKLKLESGRQGPAPASPGTSTKDDSRLWGWIADEWQSLQSGSVDWKFLRTTATFNTVANQSVYTAAEIGQPFSRLWPATLNEYQPMATADGQSWFFEPELSYDVVRRLLLPSNQPGFPAYYAITPSGSLVIAPAPDRVVQIAIDLVREPLIMSAAADEPVGLPVRHRNILVWGALKRLAVDDASSELLGRANDEYNEAWDRLWLDQGPAITVGT
jgi:hypothetical protein